MRDGHFCVDIRYRLLLLLLLLLHILVVIAALKTQELTQG